MTSRYTRLLKNMLSIPMFGFTILSKPWKRCRIKVTIKVNYEQVLMFST